MHEPNVAVLAMQVGFATRFVLSELTVNCLSVPITFSKGISLLNSNLPNYSLY
jgi:hypothetical protein